MDSILEMDNREPGNAAGEVSATSIVSRDHGQKSFSLVVDGLVDSDGIYPTGMRDDILLLSWLIVLLRAGDGEEVQFEWAYRMPAQTANCKDSNGLLSTKVMAEEVDDSVQKAAATIRSYIIQAHTAESSHNFERSLLLNTGTLTKEYARSQTKNTICLEARLMDGKLQIHPVSLPPKRPEYAATFLSESLVEITRLCISDPTSSVRSLLGPSVLDLSLIWSWNDPLALSYDFCMHERVTEYAERSPNKVAIASWDGDLTYAQIDQYSSTFAAYLAQAGSKPHDIIGICFEKSRWTIIAVLAVMKAGMTFTLMDPTLPLARLQNMALQASTKAIVASREQSELSATIVSNQQVLVIDDNTFSGSDTAGLTQSLPVVPSSTIMYIIFTSGSTGTPKGVKISHGTYSSSAIPRARAVGYTTTSRVLDFASYAFDVSIDSMMLTLGNGGCLCIPSDDERMNDINGAIRRMRINYAGLTPSVARILDADVIESLAGLGLGGEAVSATDVAIWGRSTRIIIGYGPCECTIGCTINSSAATGYDYISIGTGNGAAMWIVDPDDHETLLPVGAVGELVVEGPIVGQGYLNDPKKTAAAFVEDPKWLMAGHGHHNGRRGRLYKTGDLGKYDPDGSGGIIFVGRKDTQVKLRGQRVELGEIESQLGARLPSDTDIIVEVIVSTATGNQPMLVGFVSPRSSKQQQREVELIQLTDRLREQLAMAHADLEQVLPRYMIPTTYIPVRAIPVLISGKTDRKGLRQFGTTVDLRSLDSYNEDVAHRPLNDIEVRLRQAWSQTLKVDENMIGSEDHFFVLGGDSLAAMALVSFCRANGLSITVADAFRHPRLSAMASVVKTCDIQAERNVSAFSMITRPVDEACEEAAGACGLAPSAVEDIYPCTPTQESLFTFSLKSVKPYIAQRVALISDHFGVDEWKGAWENLVAATPILRTRLAQLQEPGLQQVICKESIDWRRSTNLKEYLARDQCENIELGQCLARYAIIHDSDDGKRYMVWTVHHVLYDGWSEPLILKNLSNHFHGRPNESAASIRDFVSHLKSQETHATTQYWRQELGGAVGPQFPTLPYRDYLPTPNGMVERRIDLTTNVGNSFTMATLIRGAWALVASQYTSSDDVVFGETLMGRDISLPGVECMIGPLIATVPIRIRIQRTITVGAYLQLVQQALLARVDHQHMGMQNIRKVSADAQYACETGTGLVIQPESEPVDSDLGFQTGDVVLEALKFNPYPLMIACGLRKDGFRVCASFDTDLVSMSHMERILAQLEETCRQLSEDVSRSVCTISHLPQAELDQIWAWNKTAPLSLDLSFGALRAGADMKQGSPYPAAVVPWICDCRNPSLLSPIGCVGEILLEGAFLPGDAIDASGWLTAGTCTYTGREGKLFRTGDLARRLENGEVQFIRRKVDLSTIQGQVWDVAELEAYFPTFLPPGYSGAAVARESTSKTVDAESEKELVVFIENQSPGGDSGEHRVDLLSYQTCDSTESLRSYDFGGDCVSAVCTRSSFALITALKRLDKFVQDSLPSYMAPTAYVPLQQEVAGARTYDRTYLSHIASKLPSDLLSRLNEGLKLSWTSELTQATATLEEQVLRESWATVLQIASAKIEVDDNFFRLGGDSVLAMKLVSNLRIQGHALTIADVFKFMRLSDAARALRLNAAQPQMSATYKPFSMLANDSEQANLLETIRGKLSNSQWSIKDAMPVTDSQAFDITATINPPRSSIQYTMLFFDHNVKKERLLQACQGLIRAHDILRTVFVKHDLGLIQVVIDELDTVITTQQVEGNLQEAIDHLCDRDILENMSLGSPFFKIFHLQHSSGEGCLTFRLSHAQYDGVSFPKLLGDLESLYKGGPVGNSLPFALYVSQTMELSVQTKARDYWAKLLQDSSLSVLTSGIGNPCDRSLLRTTTITSPPSSAEYTTASLLTAAWALLLTRRLDMPDVTFGNVTSGRSIDVGDAQNVMFPCYAFTPVRVRLEAHWTAHDLLRFVQSQTAESATHDFLGFQKIAKLCPKWPSSIAFFNSVVHHQDAIEEVDWMTFDGHRCRIEARKPHGDGAYPLKIITFTRGGELHLGVVGSETDPAFLDSCLHELTLTFHELANWPSQKLILNP